jgi:hypothetical protein
VGVRKEEDAGRGLGGVAALIADLDHPSTIRRDAAVARLRVLGARSRSALTQLVTSTASARARAAALNALEATDDRRALDAALTALSDIDEDVVVASIAVLRGWLTAAEGGRVLDALAGVALDPARTSAARLAALDALSELPRDVVQPLTERAAAAAADPSVDSPLTARQWIENNRHAPLSALHALVSTARERERGEASARLRQEWLVTRGAAHAALARRGSRVALYDLREAFVAPPATLPLDFLTAITTLGDSSCLEPLATTWAAAADDAWLRTHLQEAAAAIVRREKLTGRHSALKRLRARHPGFV